MALQTAGKSCSSYRWLETPYVWILQSHSTPDSPFRLYYAQLAVKTPRIPILSVVPLLLVTFVAYNQ